MSGWWPTAAVAVALGWIGGFGLVARAEAQLPGLLERSQLRTSGASAADTVVVPDPAAEQITALGGTIVWVSGEPGKQKLMQRPPDGTVAAVKGAPEARSYRTIDLGRGRDGKLLLTYERCDTTGSCKALSNDLDGGSARYRNLTPRKCILTTAPSQWRSRIAYGLSCGGSKANRRRTGLYVKRGARAPVRLPLPKDAVKSGTDWVDSVDLHGARVAAVLRGISDYSLSQTVGGKDMRSFEAGFQEGDSAEDARGLAIESSSTHWTLTQGQYSEGQREAIIFRRTGDCLQRERLISPPNATQKFVASDLAVDGATLYLVRPGIGVVAHTFTPDPALACP